MKRFSQYLGLVLAAAVACGSAGCKRKPQGPTPIPGAKAAPVGSGPLGAGNNTPSGATGQGTEGAPTGRNLPPGGEGTGGQTGPGGAGADAAKDKGGGIPLPGESWEGRPLDKAPFQAYTVYFDFDSSVILKNERTKIEAVAEAMKKEAPDKALLVEGHCDERGTEEYNRALGERRAQAIREYMVHLGLAADRIYTISYGKDKPLDPEHNETAWQKNRRGEFGLLGPKPTQ